MRRVMFFRESAKEYLLQKIDGRPWAPSTGTEAPLIQLARSDAR